MSDGPDTPDAVRRRDGISSIEFCERNPADLPVQAPVKFDLLVNVKAAKALGIEFPASLLSGADQVIEKDTFAAVHEFAYGTKMDK